MSFEDGILQLNKSLFCLLVLTATMCLLASTPAYSRSKRSHTAKAAMRTRRTAKGGHVLASRSGLASWHAYGHSRMITASRSYPCGTRLRITNRRTGKSVVVRVGDWGPAPWTGRALDLNKAAFARIAPVGKGQINVRYQVLSLGTCHIHQH